MVHRIADTTVDEIEIDLSIPSVNVFLQILTDESEERRPASKGGKTVTLERPDNVKNYAKVVLPRKTADILRLPCEMTSEERTKIFHTDDVSLPRSQARIHTGFHRFTEIGQVFHNKYIFNNSCRAFQIEICKMVWTNVFFFQFTGIRQRPGKRNFRELKPKKIPGGASGLP